MTEPKHIPLPKRWSDDFAAFVNERADRLAAYVVRVLDALVIVDDAHEVDFYGDEQAACAVYQTPTVPDGYVPPSAALVQDEED